MANGTVLAIVLAGGEGGRLGPLTEKRAKPVVSYGGTYRLIDFALSNLARAGIEDVWIVQQYRPYDLNRHLSNGRPWDLDRNRGGLLVMPPYTGGEKDGFAEGNADALHRQAEFIRDLAPEVVISLSADHVYRIDVDAVLRRHRETKAGCTMVTTELPGHDLTRYAVVGAEEGRIVRFDYKPEEPEGDLVGTELFVYDTDLLLTTLDEIAEKEELKDYGHQLLPRLVENGQVAEFRHEGYWRDVGTLKAFLGGHLDLLGDDPAFRPDDVRTATPLRPPAFVAKGAEIEESFVSPGARVHGRVVRSVIGPGAEVPKGVVVEDSVLLPDSRVEESVRFAIVDEGFVATTGGEGTEEEPLVLAETSQTGTPSS